MKKAILFVILFNFTLVITSQNKFGDLALDKDGNKYAVGNFENTIDLGNNNLITSNGATDIYIGKYDTKGICQWGTKIGGKNNENISAIYVEPNGNFFITGYFIGEAKFGEIKVKASSNKVFQSITLFIAKYNTSGDPIWVKTSKNTGSDSGNGITTDNKGGVYVLGTFDGQIIYDGKAAISNGKNDMCVIKINSAGNCDWIKNYGTKDENNANTIFYSKGRLLIGGDLQKETGGYVGYIVGISSETGSISWSKEIGTLKGNVEKLIVDNASNLIVTGSIEGSNNDGYDFFVNKLNSENGADVWLRKFHSNQARGKDIVCDGMGNIYATGSYIDSLRLDAFYLNGLEFDDIFFIKMNPSGKTIWAKSLGHNKHDIGTKLIFGNTEIILAGDFSKGIELGSSSLSGGENTAFMTNFDIQKNTFTNSVVLAREELKNTPNSKYSNISGKLLIGNGNDKSFLNDQAVIIEDNSGNIIKRTITDENGDFSFKNVDVAETINLIIEKNDRLKETDEIYLAQQNGIIINKLELDENKNFKYKLLPVTMTKLEPLEDDKDPLLVMKDFKVSKEEQFVLVERILYEPNSFLVPADAVNNINQVALFLRQNQKMKVEIYSHTDATGEDNSNLILSEKRANEVKLLLTKKQIQSERILIKGLGETQIINRCSNNVKCTDLEHSYNRRTEFKFIKASGF
jgi:outer membrane protein OmpA-like peptidoglycan-associated protein